MKNIKNNSILLLFLLILAPFLSSAQAGCTDNDACNFDPNALIDDGTCSYYVDCAGICGGNYILDVCGNCYDPAAQNGIIDFQYTGGLQYWTVPDGVTEIIVDAWGAEGGTSTGQNGGQNFVGGRGAHVQGTFSVNAGEVITILVGQKGANGNCGSGGGGGSFVVFNGNPLAIAGGGGGGFHCNVLGGNPGAHGLTSTNGGDGVPPPTHPSPYFRPARVGGANGNGGSSAFGSGGGGWLTAGTSNYGGTGGGAYPGAGGVPGGGYGGGGSYYSGCCGGSGGGGGYSGGSGGESDGCAGGGGGSWNAGLNQLNESGVRTGNGLVSITFNAIPACPGGCMDPLACNFDPSAEIEDGSCIYPDGCTDENACNFSPDALCDNGSCVFPGCDDPSACNYDPDAGCSDNSCAYVIDCAGVCGGNFVQDLCGNCYDPNALNDNLDFAYTGGLQYWTVPEGVNEIIIDAWGAEGGTSTGQNGGQNFIGGRGAHVQGTFLVNPGEVLEILVGQKGANGSCGSGGGGGSFVVFNGNPLAIAGGGGGGFHCNVLGGNPGGHGLTSTNGGDGTPPPTHPSPYFRPARVGGANGNGGSSAFGSGGGGWLTAGTSNYGGTGGGAYPGTGGSPGGGYGGGGSYYSGCCGGSGGGGGYSGGSGGESDGCSGGGGGSWNAGLNQLNESGVRLGDGLVSISFAGIPECPQGCTDPIACNYDPEAQLEDGSCIYPDGCTDANACNFDPSATCDDGTCTYPGCDDPSACNYDPDAGCTDNSCAFIIDCAGVCGGNFIEDLCGNCYDPNAVNGSIDFGYSGNLQYWTVPEGVTEIIIDAWGAEGGTSTGQNGGQNFIGGRGAHVQGTFLVNPGDVLEILVGQKGTNGSCGSGGGGGSFVVFNGNPLAIAGGGGGGFHCNVLGGNPGGHGLTSTNGGDGTPPPTHPSPYFRPARVGGANGNGGSSAFGSGGGGWLTAGTSNYGGTGGGAYPGAGGSPGGGYGGGGSYYSGCCGGSGGGGGYSGGSGGESDGCAGGGGGSWNAGLNQLNESGVRLGDGLVSISFAGIPECPQGCTDPIACNYDPEAQLEDGSCIYPDGCTDANACNFDPSATCDNGTCTYPGCDNPSACNYDPEAGCSDGSCIYIIDCAGVCGGDFVTDDCGNCYDPDAATGEVQFNYTGSLQYWTVPEGITEIIIDAWGAEGGTSTGQNGGQNFVGGLGAHVQGTFAVNPGDILEILVGQKGTNGSCGSGGGGGSFVVFNGIPLAIAGGGGGGFHCNVLGGNPGGHGLTSTNGGDGTPPPTHPSPYFRPARVGGANGNGGSSAFGSGGGGWLTAGTSNYGGTGGGAYPGAGGSPGGGYGGGGSYYSGCCGGSGGGGGYSGGSGGESDGCAGGGGGSWNAGINQVNESGVRAGNGLVVISFADAPLCLPGCTNPLAQNYDPEANFDDGSCLVPGCTDPNAENYNPQAIQDDGSCVYAGCTYPDALNFDPQATIDDGSCEFPAVGCGPGTYYDEVSMLCLPLPLDCPSDINSDGFVNTADLLELLADFGNSCP